MDFVANHSGKKGPNKTAEKDSKIADTIFKVLNAVEKGDESLTQEFAIEKHVAADSYYTSGCPRCESSLVV